VDKTSDTAVEKQSPNRRRFVQRMLGSASLAVPAVRTVVMAAAATQILPRTAFAGEGGGPEPGETPEIDPGSAVGALTVLAGVVMIARDRSSSKKSGSEENYQ
jgi:hypothetical protein